MKPLILYIKRNCLDDGPGIRTTVFFKGCPLSCAWCHNPESRRATPELSFSPDKCIGCETCVATCPHGATGRDNPGFIDRGKCKLCFSCAAACPSRARERLGVEMAADEIITMLKRDMPFFRTSGGGVTLSGGEPSLYMDFCSELLQKSKAIGVHTLIETCGQFDYNNFECKLMPFLDAIYADVKLVDSAAHEKYCGIGNEKIIVNIKSLIAAESAGGAPVLPRVPLVPGVTATDANLAGIAEFLKDCGARRVALLPYNPTWHGKSLSIGAAPAFETDKWMGADEIARCRAHFADFEIEGL
jgi:pyruvate formate lyase activating enzyme